MTTLHGFIQRRHLLRLRAAIGFGADLVGVGPGVFPDAGNAVAWSNPVRLGVFLAALALAYSFPADSFGQTIQPPFPSAGLTDREVRTANWKSSQDSIGGLPVGEYVLQFSDVAGFTNLDEMTVIVDQGNNTFEGIYEIFTPPPTHTDTPRTPPTPTSTGGCAGETVLLEETWSRHAVGAAPSAPWEISGEADIKVVDQGNPGPALYFLDEGPEFGGVTWNSAKDFARVITLDFDVLIEESTPSSNGINVDVFDGSRSLGTVAIIYTNGTTILGWDGRGDGSAAIVRCEQIAEDVWTSIRVIVDFPAARYSILVDGSETPCTDLGFVFPGPANGVGFWVSDSSTVAVQIDNIRLCEENCDRTPTPTAPTYTPTITPTMPTGVPAPIAPDDGAAINNDVVTFSWTGVSGVARYQINVRAEDDIGAAGGFLVATVRGTSFSYDLSFVNPVYLGRTFYWGVRTWDVPDNPGEWSAPASFVYGPGAAPIPCVGDCDGDGTVAVSEIVKAVNIVLGTAKLRDPERGCLAADGDGDGAVLINELVAAVRNALGSCSSVDSSP